MRTYNQTNQRPYLVLGAGQGVDDGLEDERGQPRALLQRRQRERLVGLEPVVFGWVRFIVIYMKYTMPPHLPTLPTPPHAPVERQEDDGLQGRAGGVVALAPAPARRVKGRAELHLCFGVCLFCLEGFGGVWGSVGGCERCFHTWHEVIDKQIK